MAADYRVKINVGGTHHEVSVKTLEKYPETKLGRLFSSEGTHEAEVDSNGEYWFDRNGRSFDFILGYYRSGKILPPSDLTVQQVLDELSFWEIDHTSYLESQAPVQNHVESIPQEADTGSFHPTELLAHLQELPLNEAVETSIILLRDNDVDMIQVGRNFLAHLLEKSPEINSKAGIKAEVLYHLAFANYRLGNLSKAKIYLNECLEIDPSHRTALDLRILIGDSASSYIRLGMAALAITVVGAFVIRGFYRKTSKSSKK